MSFLVVKNLTKRFPGVLALDQFSVDVQKGSCHALVGENGAGKSTAGKILAGVHTADQGQIFLNGREIRPANPFAARHLGIAMVHQELAFCPNLTVAENLCLGDLPRRAGWVSRKAMKARAEAMLSQVGAHIDPDVPIGTLSTGHEQVVQIAAAVGTGAQVVIMDEPTSSLSMGESQHLFELLARLKKQGITVIYVSHRLEEIFQLCDQVTVLRDGRHIATESIHDTSPERVVHQMIGRELHAQDFDHISQPLGPERMRVEQLSSNRKFQDISFSLRAGEILGLGGLVGAGRSEVAQAIFGLDPAVSGRVWVNGTPLKLGSVQASLRAGIGLVPEDRKRQGLVLSMSCRENASLAVLKDLTRAGFVRRHQEETLVSQYFDQLQVKTPSLSAPIAGLSGGNQQKIALAKWLARQCQVLIIDEPTRGVDVGAKAEIHRIVDQLACQGLALLLISSDLPELMSLSRRILVLREGRAAGELQQSDFSEPKLMRMMAGVV